MRKHFYYRPPKSTWRVTFKPFIMIGYREEMSTEYISGVFMNKNRAIESYFQTLQHRGIKEALITDIYAIEVKGRPIVFNYENIII